MRRTIAAILVAASLLATPASAQAVDEPAQVVEEPAPPPASPDFYPSRYVGRGDAFNCADFASQADAQAVLRAEPLDPNKLDTELDGVACESRPLPKDVVPVPR